MRELKILGVVIFFTAIIYIGVEPLAHSQMHPHVAPANFEFDKADIELSEHFVKHAQEKVDAAQKFYDKNKNEDNKKLLESAKNDLQKEKKELQDYNDFWKEINQIPFAKGDAKRGAEVFTNGGCVGCHGLEVAGMPNPMSDADAAGAFGVAPPDLSTAGLLYDEKYLAALIKKPTMAMKNYSKFSDEKPFPMTDFFGAGGEDMNLEIADLIAYLKSVAPKSLTDKQVYENACLRCHDMKYAHEKTSATADGIIAYLGSVPPDLSIMIRSKGAEYLNEFINDPQKHLKGTAMPRVGLKQVTQEQVVNYMDKTGDRKKDERNALGWKVMLFFVFLSFIAYLWKKEVWKEVH